jgi:predicted enzyme related to lactoylglutathione lyase
MNVKTVFSGYSVNNSDEAKRFYGEVLGLTLDDEEMGLTYKLPSGGKLFIYAKPDHQPATYTCLNFVVEDINEAVKELKAKGVTFEHYEGMTGQDGIARGSQVNRGPDIAWFKDPAANILAVIQS